jgi:curved DNA-binding protein CbpA
MNHYQLLGVKEDASIEQIKAAYKKRVKEFHPDFHQGDEYYTELAKHLREAYETLIDPQRRKKYDDERNTININNQNTSSEHNKRDKRKEIIDEFRNDVNKIYEAVIRVDKKGTLSYSKVISKLEDVFNPDIRSILNSKLKEEKLKEAALIIVEIIRKIPLDIRIESSAFRSNILLLQYLVFSEGINVNFLFSPEPMSSSWDLKLHLDKINKLTRCAVRIKPN